MPTLLLAALLGMLVAALPSLIPAMHITVMAGAALSLAAGLPFDLPPQTAAMFLLGMIVAYAMLNTLPAMFFAAPDESMVFAVPPARRYLSAGRGNEAIVLTGLGSLGGLMALAALSPFMSLVFPPIRAVLQPHLPWILGLIVVYMMMTEWPAAAAGRASARALVGAWSPLLAGALTFLLSGLLGFVLLYRSPALVAGAAPALFPAMVGLFAVAGALQQMAVGSRPPRQHLSTTLDATPGLIARGLGAGALGGSFAALFPALTGGIGGFMAGQATAGRDDRPLLISQGASKALYYVGAYLFFFVPGMGSGRGGLSSIPPSAHTPITVEAYWAAIACMAACGALSFPLLLGLGRILLRVMPRFGHRAVAGVSLAAAVSVVWFAAGPGGVAVAAVATAIGLIPILWQARRAHCLGVLLLPLTLSLTGLGEVAARWLGLIGPG